IPGGKDAVEKMMKMGKVMYYIREMYKHCKPIAAIGEATKLIEASKLPEIIVFDQPAADKGVVTSANADKVDDVVKLFSKALIQSRFWEREKFKDMIPV